MKSSTTARWFSVMLAVVIVATQAWAPAARAAQPEKSERWSFQPIRAVVPPTPKNRRWVRNPIDAFILARLEQSGLKAAPTASPVTLLRRTCFDVIGLPPTPEETEACSKEKPAEAFEQVVQRLLASPQYGERWARHWLDGARHGDTGGFEHDLTARNAWRYRDYVIRSFNTNKPFDRFIEEQIAGDELWPEDADAVAATGLFAVGPVSQDSSMMSTQLEYEWLRDAADTTGALFMGLTFACARCHNHKYDPLTSTICIPPSSSCSALIIRS